MRERLGVWWSEEIARRGAVDVLFDLWWLSVVLALILGILLGAFLAK